MTAPALIQRAGAFSTQRWVIPAGQEVQFDTDAVQLLITELDNAAEITLQLNHGQEGRAWKGFEARGHIAHVRAANAAAEAVTLEVLLVSPGLQVTDRRLNQVGDLGLVTAFALFDALGVTTIPAQSVRQVAAGDANRRYIVLTNPPGQFREIYLSGAAVAVPQITLANKGFEDETGWSNIISPPHAGDSNWIISAGGTVITAPHGGAGMLWQDGNLAQTITSQASGDLVTDDGFDAALIDTGALTYEASVWAASEDNDSMDLQVTWLDGVGGATVRTDLLDNAGVTAFATAGWQKKTLTNNIPATARACSILLRENGGSVEKAFDDFALIVNGVPPSLDELAGMVMPSQMIRLPASGPIYAYNPHTSDQDLMVGEIKGS